MNEECMKSTPNNELKCTLNTFIRNLRRGHLAHLILVFRVDAFIQQHEYIIFETILRGV
jgi:hypothetical protein